MSFKSEGKNGKYYSLNLGVVDIDVHLSLYFLIHIKYTFWFSQRAVSLCRDSLCFKLLI